MARNCDDPVEIIEQVNRLWNEGNTRRAAELLNRAAAKGIHEVYNHLGVFYEHGIGIRRDVQKALRLYKLACRIERNTGTMINIAILYRDQGNLPRARFWLTKAIKLGDGEAALEMAKLLLCSAASKGQRVRTKVLRLLRWAIRSDQMSEAGRDEAVALLNKVRER